MLNTSPGFARKFKQLLWLSMIATFLLSGCGKRKPPQPPLERVPQRLEIDGRQIGDRIDVTWKMPARNAPDGDTLKITRIDVYRLSEPLDDSLSLTEAEFASRSTMISSIQVGEDDFGLKQMTFSDKLNLIGQSVRLRYALRTVNESGQKAVFSNFFLVEPVANVAQSPRDPQATVSQESIQLTWTPPTKNLDGTEPANILGYQLFRAEEGKPFRSLLKSPSRDTVFEDRDFEFGKRYRYFLRTVSLGRNAESIDSFNSETIEVVPKDTFPPASPEALTIASAPNVISVFFAFNLEPDIANYKIYRSTDRTAPVGDWDLIATIAADTNSFQDKSVKADTLYFYYVVAIDKFGNVSEPSEIVGETAL
ncbi:MAG: hypothetical protein R2684_07565 [Pyrinomonadaceae bacterium]